MVSGTRRIPGTPLDHSGAELSRLVMASNGPRPLVHGRSASRILPPCRYPASTWSLGND